MIRRAKPILLFTLVFAAVALLGSAPAWAVKPACQEVQIFGTIKFVWDPGCPAGSGKVFFFDTTIEGCSGCTPTTTDCDSCWREGVDTTLVMCDCKGSGCVADLQTNIGNMSSLDVTVKCFPIRDSGPSLGVPLFLNPPRGCIGGRCFR
jgi:hypothetical protein